MAEVKPEEPANTSLEEDNEPEESVYSDPNGKFVLIKSENFSQKSLYKFDIFSCDYCLVP